MIEVTLTWSEMSQAANVGVRRQIEALRAEKKDSYGFDGNTGWQIHIEGALGELAFCKAIDRYWGGTINTYKIGGDVGSNIQIRTRSKLDYDLIVRNSDRDDDIFVLVTGQAPRYNVVGWITGKEAKRNEWRRTYGGRPPAFFVPQKELRAIDELKNR